MEESGFIPKRDLNETTTKLGESGIKGNDDIKEIGKPDCLPISANKFCADYSIRGTATCRICNKFIPEGELRIGSYVTFNNKVIIHYHHVPCSFMKMGKARVDSNVVKHSDEIDGFDELTLADQTLLVNIINANMEARVKPIAKNYRKRIVPTHVPSTERRKKLKILQTPFFKVLYTNADQFTLAKKNELLQRIITEKPMIIAVCEINIKNGKEMTETDYNIDDYSINSVNIETSPRTGRGGYYLHP